MSNAIAITPPPPSGASSSSSPTHNLSEGERQILRRFAGGTLGGFLQAVTSHPLDTVKARLQTGRHPTISSCILHTWKDEGLRGFFRGVQVPIFFGGMFNSVLFSLNQLMRNVISPSDRKPGEPLALWRIALAAQMATPFYVLVLTPIERVKIIMQLEMSKAGEKKAGGFVKSLQKIHQHGSLRGFMRGYCPNVGVHLVGLPSYFVGYQVTRSYVSQFVCPDSALGHFVLPVCSGVMAGVCFWLTCYPFDLIKTKMQATHHKANMREIFREIYVGGFFSLYKGLYVSLLRSAPANASVWIGLEYTQRYMIEHGF